VKPRLVVPTELANRDVDEAIDFYLREHAPQAALEFIDAIEKAFQTLAGHPAIGSLRYGIELSIPGLRCWQVAGFPHLVFYVEQEDGVHILRVLHGHRDIPAWMREPEQPR
jgi:toxin ParE1/3/4